MTKLEKLHSKALSANCGVKYFKRLKQFKSNNFKFDLESQNGTSYDWWDLTNIQDGKLIFNIYVYSNSTAKHIHKMQQIVNALGLKPIYVNTSKNIRSSDWQKEYLLDLTRSMLSNEMFLSRKKNKDWYLGSIEYNKKQIEMIYKNFGIKLTKKEINEIKKSLVAEDNARKEKQKLERLERKKKIDALKPQLSVFDAIDLHDSNKANDLSEISL